MELLPNELLDLILSKSHVETSTWVENHLHISLYANGIRPNYYKWDLYDKKKLVKFSDWQDEYKCLVDDKILKRHPRENERGYEYRKSVFPLIPSTIINRATEQVLSSIFQDSNYSFDVGSEITKEYLNNFDVIEWLKKDCFSFFRNDPNGALVIDVDFEIDTTKINTPNIKFIGSKHIIYNKDNVFAYYKDDIYYVYTDTYYFQAYKEKDRYVIISYYEHNLGINNWSSGFGYKVNGYFKSWFDSVLSYADAFVNNYTDYELLLKNYSYPYKQIVEQACNNCSGSGHIDDCNDKGDCKAITCNICSGKGVMSTNPGENFTVKAPFRDDELNGYVQPELIKFINPDVSVIEESRKNLQNSYNDLKKSLYVYDKDSNTVESGVSLYVQKEPFYNFCQYISNDLFTILEFTLRVISSWQNVTSVSGLLRYDTTITIEVQKPISFNGKDKEQLQLEYENSLKNSYDLSVRYEAEQEYINKAYSDNEVLKKKISFKKFADILHNYTNDELLKLYTLGSFTADEIRLHSTIDNKIERLIYNKGTEWFLSNDFNTILSNIQNEQ